MYSDYFGFSEAPFSIAPDPRYLFMSEKHREALAHLLYGVGDQGGFIVLTGEVGTGKTTICRCLLQQIPDNTDVAFIINPRQNTNQLLQSTFAELGLPFQKGANSKDLIDQFNHYLLQVHAKGRNTILIIDEAQNLPKDVLEQLRLLTNLETNEKKLLQLLLIGQPELNDLLNLPELRQLSQRVTARYHLNPLSRHEINQYIDHRLAVAGVRKPLFTKRAVQTIYKFSNGVPRLVNLISDRSLLGVYSENALQVTPKQVRKAVKEVLGNKQSSNGSQLLYWSLLTACVAGLVLIGTTTDWLTTAINQLPLIGSKQ
jgi:general secretion pathway protein A